VLQATNPAFAELVETPGTLRSDRVRVIPFRKRWLPMALRYAACFVAVLIGSAYLYQRFGPDTPTHKSFITQQPQRHDIARKKGLLTADTYIEEDSVVEDDSAPASVAAETVLVSTKIVDSAEKSTEVARAVVSKDADSGVAGDAVEYDLADKERLERWLTLEGHS